MQKQSGRPTEEDMKTAVDCYSDMLFRLCVAMLGNRTDAEDALSGTMLRYWTKGQRFDSEEHRKAWLLRVASNICKDMCRFRKRNAYVNLDDLYDLCVEESDVSIMGEVMRLPMKQRVVIHLYYIEGYSTKEIAEILSISPAAVRKRLQYGREQLKLELEEEDSHEARGVQKRDETHYAF